MADANGPAPDARSLPRRAYGSSPSVDVDVNDFGNVTLTTYDAAGRTLKEESLLTSSTTGDGVHIGRSTTGRQMPTDLKSYVEDTIRVAGKPSMDRITKSPRQRCRALPTRQMPTDLASYVKEVFLVAGKPAMIRLITSPIQACRGLPT